MHPIRRTARAETRTQPSLKGGPAQLIFVFLLACILLLASCSSRPRLTPSPTPPLTETGQPDQTPTSSLPEPTSAVSDTLSGLAPAIRLGKGTASALAASPDGRLLAVLTPLGVYAYHADTYQQAWFQPLVKPYSLAFSQDNLRLAIGMQDGEVSILNAQNGSLQRHFKTEGYAQVSWSPDGSRLVTGSACMQVTVWDTESSASLRQLSYQCSEGASLTQAAWSADGQRIYAVSSYGKLTAWDAENYAPFIDFAPDLQGGFADGRLFASPRGRLLVLADFMGGGGVLLLDGLTGRQVADLSDPAGSTINATAWSPDGSQIATGYAQGSIVIWEAATGRQLSRLEALYAPAGIAWLPADTQGQQRLLGPLTSQVQISLVDPATGSLLGNILGLTPVANAMSWGTEGLLTTSGTFLMNWGPTPEKTGGIFPQSQETIGTTEAWVISWSLAQPRSYLFETFGPQGNSFLVGDGASRWSMLVEDNHNKPAHATAWSPDGSKLASGNVVWSVQDGAVLQQLADSSDRARDVSAWSPDGKLLASGDSLYLAPVVLWDPLTGQILLTLRTEAGNFNPWLGALAFSPDGNFLAAGGSLQNPNTGQSDGMLILWNTLTGQQDWLLTGSMPDDRVLSVAWSPDGQRLAAGLNSGRIVLWDTSSGQPAALLDGHAEAVTGLAWSPDGKRLASRSLDGTVCMWKF